MNRAPECQHDRNRFEQSQHGLIPRTRFIAACHPGSARSASLLARITRADARKRTEARPLRNCDTAIITADTRNLKDNATTTRNARKCMRSIARTLRASLSLTSTGWNYDVQKSKGDVTPETARMKAWMILSYAKTKLMSYLRDIILSIFIQYDN